MPTPLFKNGRAQHNKLDQVATIPVVSGLSAKEYGFGPVRQTVFRFVNVPFTFTDNGTNGSGSLKIADLPKGVCNVLAAAGRIGVTWGTVTDAGLVGAVGTAAAAADGTLTSTEANIVPSTASAASAGSATFTAKATASGIFDGTSTATGIYVNFASANDPTTNNSMTLNGYLVVTWVQNGDAAAYDGD